MCLVTFATVIGVMSGCAADTPSRLLDPANPSLSTNWRPPPSPTAGLQTLQPVAVRNWLDQNHVPGAGGSMGGMKTMPGMKGIGGMKGMPGMGGGK